MNFLAALLFSTIGFTLSESHNRELIKPVITDAAPPAEWLDQPNLTRFGLSITGPDYELMYIYHGQDADSFVLYVTPDPVDREVAPGVKVRTQGSATLGLIIDHLDSIQQGTDGRWYIRVKPANSSFFQ